ncbi:MAG TPA: MFS transporter [Bauldia sp.]|nr:MFS transporter [Bauldia sp.]
MTDTAQPVAAAEHAEARRNALVLAVASAISGSAPPIAITLGGLAGLYLLGDDKSLATLPVSGFNIGVAAGAIPAAMLMRAVGRRAGFMTGTLAGIAGGIVSALAVIYGLFIGLVIGFALVGVAASFAQQFRFAAADAGDAAFRARAISWVMVGGVAAAIIGPQTVILTRDLLSPIPFAGAFFAMAVLAALGLVVLSFLGGQARAAPPKASRQGGRSLAEIARQPRFIVAVLCGMGAFSLMSLVMTAAPLAMVACGLGEDNAALGIQWHVLAMFLPSFFTGALIARYGVDVIVTIGMALLAACGIVALAGIDLANFWIALILLGLGWNFGFIGATAMLTETYRPEERGKVQGLNDFLVFGSVAVASLASGSLLTSVGWDWVNYLIFPVVGICILAVASAAILRRRSAG